MAESLGFEMGNNSTFLGHIMLVTESLPQLAALNLPLNSIVFADEANKFTAREYSINSHYSYKILTIDEIVASPYLPLILEKRDISVFVDFTRSTSIGSAWKSEVQETFKEYARILGVDRFLERTYGSADQLYNRTILNDTLAILPEFRTSENSPMQTNAYIAATIPLSMLVLIGAVALLFSRPKKGSDAHILSPNLLHFDVAQQLEKEAFDIVGKNQENVRGGVCVMEALSLAGYLMFCVSGSFLDVTSTVDFQLALSIFGASSCILAILSMLLERNSIFPSIFIVGTFMTGVSLIACGYAILNHGSGLILAGYLLFY